MIEYDIINLLLGKMLHYFGENKMPVQSTVIIPGSVFYAA